MSPVAPGHYSLKQLGSQCGIVRWTHGARFRTAVALAGRHPREKLLDYGSGDGTFLAMVSDGFAACVGADIVAQQVDDCRERFRDIHNVSFCLVSELDTPEHTHAYDLVTCMETLEHCPEPAVEIVLADLDRLCSRDGTILISVPIETGPVFPMKYLVRKIAGWRRVGDYQWYESYSLGDAARMLFATPTTQVRRPLYGPAAAPIHSHYGFNWRKLRARIDRAFDIERTLFSPAGFSRGWLSSQAWLVCRPKQRTGLS